MTYYVTTGKFFLRIVTKVSAERPFTVVQGGLARR